MFAEAEAAGCGVIFSPPWLCVAYRRECARTRALAAPIAARARNGGTCRLTLTNHLWYGNIVAAWQLAKLGHYYCGERQRGSSPSGRAVWPCNVQMGAATGRCRSLASIRRRCGIRLPRQYCNRDNNVAGKRVRTPGEFVVSDAWHALRQQPPQRLMPRLRRWSPISDRRSALLCLLPQFHSYRTCVKSEINDNSHVLCWPLFE